MRHHLCVMVYGMESQQPLNDEEFERLRALAASGRLELDARATSVHFAVILLRLVRADAMDALTEEDLVWLEEMVELDRRYTTAEIERIFRLTGGPRIGGPTYQNLPAR